LCRRRAYLLLIASIATRYATRLRDTSTFEHRTLEEMIQQLRLTTNAAWVAAFVGDA
jgi:hypothetical protein